MRFLTKFKNIWTVLLGAGLIALVVLNFSDVLKGAGSLFNACLPLIIGAMLAFILNLMMDPISNLARKSKHPFLSKHASSIGMISSVLLTLILFIVILVIIIPNVYEAIRVVSKEAPGYIEQLKSWLQRLTRDNPALQSYISSLDTDWQSTIKNIGSYFTKGASGIFDSTLDIVTSLSGMLYNLFIILVFALFVLSSKQMFVKTYHLLCRLYLTPARTATLTRDLRILDSSYRSFVIGSLIQAAILIVILAVADFALGIPYALMAAVIVGVINIIPMVGAFIGGGIAAFIIFTASPMKCLIFLIMLVIVQEISSNVLYPRIIGNRIGLPGIYVMITIVVGGALFGISGMILGVPLVATCYRIYKIHLEQVADRRKIEHDPLVKELHDSNMQLNSFLQKKARNTAEREGAQYIDIQRQENLEEEIEIVKPEDQKPENNA